MDARIEKDKISGDDLGLVIDVEALNSLATNFHSAQPKETSTVSAPSMFK
jgi:hypothetical protein